MNIPSFNIPMPVLMWLGVGFVILLTIYLFHRFVYRRGYGRGYAEGHEIGKKEGQEIAKLKGAFCDVCQKVAEKFVAFKMHVICESCFAAISANKDMKCKFCNNPVENCSCT